MKIKKRKHQFSDAVAELVSFLESFDFSGYKDLDIISSDSVHFCIKGLDDLGIDTYRFFRTYFRLKGGELYLKLYDGNSGWRTLSIQSLPTANYMNIPQLIELFSAFLEQINAEIEIRDAEIEKSLQFFKTYKNIKK